MMVGLVTWKGHVDQSWIDELDHVNFLEYQRVADHGSLELWKQISGDHETKLEFVMTETYVRYIRELTIGMEVEVESLLVAYDDKRFHLHHNIKSDNSVMCTVETVNLCFDPEIRKVAKFSPAMVQALASLPVTDAQVDARLVMARKSASKHPRID